MNLGLKLLLIFLKNCIHPSHLYLLIIILEPFFLPIYHTQENKLIGVRTEVNQI